MGAALAYALNAGFVPIRKEGKLPFKTKKAAYRLEYGKAAVEIHQDAIRRGSRVILVDDVLATGGTARAAVSLLHSFNAQIEKIYFLIELESLKGRGKLKNLPVHSLISFS